MATTNPSLVFDGKTEEAFNFYRSVFGGEFTSFMRWKEIPGAKISPTDAERIMHIALPIGKSNVIMAGDSRTDGARTLVVGNNVTITLECESKEEANRLYKGLAEGGKEDPDMPLGDAFWGTYFGMLTDKFGIRWNINYTYPKI